jgi:hypothetical protein
MQYQTPPSLCRDRLSKEAFDLLEETYMKRRLPGVLFNTITLIGVLIALVTLGAIILLTVVEYYSTQQHPYMGIVTLLILPVFLNLGLLVAVLGTIRAYRRTRAGKSVELHLPRIDLNERRHRNAFLLFCFGPFLFLVITAFGSYQAYEYTESVQFCGQVCHTVMKPEFTAYKASPHARVGCVECHIGPGATWFVRSKLSGSYQVYPIANLRPAKETCEQCHWPNHFYSAKLQGKTYFLSDEQNSKCQMNMLMKIGGGNPAHGATEGIHLHMYIANTISYVALDPQRSVIPYIESHAPDGTVRIYRSTETPISEEQVRKSKKHVVDCIECHNRPTHIYHHPAQSVNQAMAQGLISPDLPEVKRVTVEALEKPYKTEREALESIRKEIEEFYRKQYPQVVETRKAALDQAIQQTRKIYSLNYFPEMKVSWRAYPDHIGHMYSPGCFRCHDNKHVSNDGKVLTTDCNLCHTLLSQKFDKEVQKVSLNGLQWRHPMDIGDAWKEMQCSDSSCHGAPEEEKKTASAK